MNSFSRWLARIELARGAAIWLGLAVLAVPAAYGFAAYFAKPTPAGIAAAAALVAVTGSGLLYAWRPGTGGSGD
jgi:hypothetical protein